MTFTVEPSFTTRLTLEATALPSTVTVTSVSSRGHLVAADSALAVSTKFVGLGLGGLVAAFIGALQGVAVCIAHIAVPLVVVDVSSYNFLQGDGQRLRICIEEAANNGILRSINRNAGVAIQEAFVRWVAFVVSKP